MERRWSGMAVAAAAQDAKVVKSDCVGDTQGKVSEMSPRLGLGPGLGLAP